MQTKMKTNETEDNYFEYHEKREHRKAAKQKSRRRSSDNEQDQKYKGNNLSNKNKSDCYAGDMKTMNSIKSNEKFSRELELEYRNQQRYRDTNPLYGRHKDERKIKRESEADRKTHSKDKKMAKRYESNVVESELSSSSYHQNRRDSETHKSVRKVDSSGMLSDDELSRMSSSTDRRKKKKKKEKKHRETHRVEDTDSTSCKARTSSSKPAHYSRSPSTRRRSTSVAVSTSEEDSGSEFARHVRHKRERRDLKHNNLRRS